MENFKIEETLKDLKSQKPKAYELKHNAINTEILSFSGAPRPRERINI